MPIATAPQQWPGLPANRPDAHPAPHAETEVAHHASQGLLRAQSDRSRPPLAAQAHRARAPAHVRTGGLLTRTMGTVCPLPDAHARFPAPLSGQPAPSRAGRRPFRHGIPAANAPAIRRPGHPEPGDADPPVFQGSPEPWTGVDGFCARPCLKHRYWPGLVRALVSSEHLHAHAPAALAPVLQARPSP